MDQEKVKQMARDLAMELGENQFADLMRNTALNRFVDHVDNLIGEILREEFN